MALSKGLPQGCCYIQMPSEKGLQMELLLRKPGTRDRNNIYAWPCLPRRPWYLILLQPKALACQEGAAATRECPRSAVVCFHSTSSPPFWCCLQVPALWISVGASGEGISTTLYPRLPPGGPVRRALPSRRSVPFPALPNFPRVPH